MNLVFAYDERVAQDDRGNVYVGSSLNQQIIKRYLQYFDHMTLIARPTKGNADLSRMNRIDANHFSVVVVPDLRENIKQFVNPSAHKKVKQLICEQIGIGDGVIVRTPSVNGAIAADYYKNIGKPYLVEIVGCPWDSYWNHSGAGKVLAPFEFLRQRQVVWNADYALYVTDHFLQKRYPCRGNTAAISDVELPARNKSVLDARLEKILINKRKLKIGTAGALIPYKGQQYVIKALARLKKEGNTDFEYHIAGDGEEVALRALAQKLDVTNQIVFEGRLSHDQMFSWFDEMDLYIQPSTVEAMPRALIEAMSRALPCVGTRVGSIPELIGSSCVFEKRDVERIVGFLKSISVDWMIDRAKDNFEHCREFQRDLLENRRKKLYVEFTETAKGE